MGAGTAVLPAVMGAGAVVLPAVLGAGTLVLSAVFCADAGMLPTMCSGAVVCCQLCRALVQ